MSGTARKTDLKLWESVAVEIAESDKGGKPGQWSARKAQMATATCKRRGGGYSGRKAADNRFAHWKAELARVVHARERIRRGPRLRRSAGGFRNALRPSAFAAAA